MAAVTFKKEVSVGTLIHLVGLAVTALLFWDRMDQRQKQLIEEAEQSRKRLERVEHYLSMKDPSYWQMIREMNFDPKKEEAQPHGKGRTVISKLQTR